MKIIEKDDCQIVKFDKPAIGVISYELDDNGVITSVGIVKESNPLFETGYTENIIMGGVEPDDTSLLYRAALELKEEAGIVVKDGNKWHYLGEVFTSKISPDSIHLFSVDVTGVPKEEPQGDGKENILDFSMRPVQDALDIGDSILISAFFKLFMKIYSKDFKPVNL
jgi:8-oxo-dGTP pyrophosphatase MutT (NUDIX family)